MKAVTLVRTDDLSRDEWLAYRRGGIGGSDVGAMLGLSRWKSPLGLYYEKRGEMPDQEAGEAAEWGTALEGIVADRFAERTGCLIDRLPAILQHPEHPFMLCNLDRYVVAPDGTEALLEVKTANQWLADDWADGGFPAAYEAQVMHSLAVTGFARAYLTVLIGGQRMPDPVVIERDEDLIADLIDLERDFWARVVEGRPPPADGLAATEDALKRRWSRSEPGMVLDLTAEQMAAVEALREAKERARAAEATEREAANAVRMLLGEAESGVFRGLEVVTYRTHEPRKLRQRELALAHPGLVAEFTETEPQRRLLLPKARG